MAAPTRRRQKDQAFTAANQRIEQLREYLKDAESEIAEGALKHDVELRIAERTSRVTVACSDYGRLL